MTLTFPRVKYWDKLDLNLLGLPQTKHRKINLFKTNQASTFHYSSPPGDLITRSFKVADVAIIEMEAGELLLN